MVVGQEIEGAGGQYGSGAACVKREKPNARLNSCRRYAARRCLLLNDDLIDKDPRVAAASRMPNGNFSIVDHFDSYIAGSLRRD